MSDAALIPHEIALNILELAARYDRDHIGLEPERNAMLAACALVCRAWRAPVQKMLFTDVTLGTTFYSEGPDEYRIYGSTGPALESLVAVLASFKASGNALRHQIRSIHLVVGFTLYDSNGLFPTQDFAQEPFAEHIVRAITLCPELVHLNLSLGVVMRGRTNSRRRIMFPLDSMNLLAAEIPPRLRQLRVTPGWGDTLSSASPRVYDHVDEGPAFQILSLLAPSLTVLDFDVRLDFDDAPSAPVQLPPLPVLHTLYSDGATQEIRFAIYTQAPSLRKASIPMSLRVREFIPGHVEELVISHPHDDVSHLLQLKTLALVNFGTPPRAEDGDASPHVLRTLPRSLEHLVLSTAAAAADPEDSEGHGSAMEATVAAVRGLPNFKSLILAPRWHQDPAPDHLLNLDSYGIPIEISHTYWHKVFPCAA